MKKLVLAAALLACAPALAQTPVPNTTTTTTRAVEHDHGFDWGLLGLLGLAGLGGLIPRRPTTYNGTTPRRPPIP
jgi:MYXO-CTERM domain-containing protein